MGIHLIHLAEAHAIAANNALTTELIQQIQALRPAMEVPCRMSVSQFHSLRERKKKGTLRWPDIDHVFLRRRHCLQLIVGGDPNLVAYGAFILGSYWLLYPHEEVPTQLLELLTESSDSYRSAVCCWVLAHYADAIAPSVADSMLQAACSATGMGDLNERRRVRLESATAATRDHSQKLLRQYEGTLPLFLSDPDVCRKSFTSPNLEERAMAIQTCCDLFPDVDFSNDLSELLMTSSDLETVEVISTSIATHFFGTANVQIMAASLHQLQSPMNRAYRPLLFRVATSVAGIQPTLYPATSMISDHDVDWLLSIFLGVE